MTDGAQRDECALLRCEELYDIPQVPIPRPRRRRAHVCSERNKEGLIQKFALGVGAEGISPLRFAEFGVPMPLACPIFGVDQRAEIVISHRVPKSHFRRIFSALTR